MFVFRATNQKLRDLSEIIIIFLLFCVYIYIYITFSLAFRVLCRIFGTEMSALTGDCRKPRNEEFHCYFQQRQ